MLTAASNHNGNCSKLARSRFINAEDARPVRPFSWVRPEVASYLNVTFTRFCLAIIAGSHFFSYWHAGTGAHAHSDAADTQSTYRHHGRGYRHRLKHSYR